MKRHVKRVSLLLLVSAVLASAAQAQGAQKKGGGKGPAPRGARVLWKAPADISSRDLFHGPGGRRMAPAAPFTFVEEETGGYSVKYRVRDRAGRVWVAKAGNEAQSETAATRLLWAVGYPVEITYLLPCARIGGAPEPRKEVERCAGGGFANVRFEARPQNYKRLDEWKWSENPFTGTMQMQGLVVLMALLNNWDLKDENNKVIYVPGGRGELRYVISDLGATFGKTGSLPLLWRITRSRNNPKDYAGSGFVGEVKNGRVQFDYGGKKQGLFDDISVAEARWIGGWLARLSDRQIGDAFRAANYTPEEVRTLTRAVRDRINQLVRLRPEGRLGRRD